MTDSNAPGHFKVHATIVDLGDFVAPVPDLELPPIESRTFMLLDDDGQTCRVISQDELEASYVDNNIATFQLDDLNPLTLDADIQMVTLTYPSGGQTSIKLGLIDWDAAIRAPQYAQRDGIIYPIDESGNLMLNVVNTPNLVNIRKWYHEKTKEASDTDVKYAEVVHAFTEILSNVSFLDGI